MSENYDDREKWSDMQLLSQYARGMSTNPKGLFFDSVVASAILRRMSASELLEKKLTIAMKGLLELKEEVEYDPHNNNSLFFTYTSILNKIDKQIAALDTTTAPESSNSDEDEWKDVELKDVELKDGYVKENDVIHWKPDGKLIVKHGDDHIAYDIASLLTPPTDIAKITRRVPKKKVDELTAEHMTGKVAELQKAMLDAMDIMTGALEIKHHPQDEYDKMDKALKGIASEYRLWHDNATYALDALVGISEILREAGYAE